MTSSEERRESLLSHRLSEDVISGNSRYTQCIRLPWEISQSPRGKITLRYEPRLKYNARSQQRS